MFLRFISLVILISTAQQVLAARAKPFTIGDCEKIVRGRKGEMARKTVSAWLKDFNFAGLELLRVSVSEENLTEDHDFGDTDDEDQVPTRYKAPPLNQELPLSNLELAAFGISQGSVIPVKDLRVSIKSKSESELVLSAFHGDSKVGETSISVDRLRIGFQNRVQFYQSYWKGEGYETDVESFFGDYGYVLLPAGDRFAFVFPLIATNKPPMESEYFEMSIFSMRKCPGREAVLMKELLFPEEGQPSGSKNICLDPLGLKITLPYQGEE